MTAVLIPCPGTAGQPCASDALIARGQRGCSGCAKAERRAEKQARPLAVPEQIARARKAAQSAADHEFSRGSRWRR